MDTERSKAWLFVRYGIAGVCGASLQTMTLYGWVRWLGLEEHYLIGATIGFCISLVVTFTLQKYWTFGDRGNAQWKRQLFSYTSIALICLCLNVVLLHLSKIIVEAFGHDFFGIWYLVAQIAVIGILAVFSFIANFIMTFNTHHE